MSYQDENHVYDGTLWRPMMGVNSGGLGIVAVAEQFAPTAEDNANGVYAEVIKPLAVATYTRSLGNNNGAVNAANYKASAGNLFSIQATNLNAAARFIFFVNSASAPVAGSASIIAPVVVPASGASTIILGDNFFGTSGLNFSSGIGIAMMTTITGGTLATNTDCYWSLTFK